MERSINGFVSGGRTRGGHGPPEADELLRCGVRPVGARLPGRAMGRVVVGGGGGGPQNRQRMWIVVPLSHLS